MLDRINLLASSKQKRQNFVKICTSVFLLHPQLWNKIEDFHHMSNKSLTRHFGIKISGTFLDNNKGDFHCTNPRPQDSILWKRILIFNQVTSLSNIFGRLVSHFIFKPLAKWNSNVEINRKYFLSCKNSNGENGML